MRQTVPAVDCSFTKEALSCPGDGLGLVQLEAVAPRDPCFGRLDKIIVKVHSVVEDLVDDNHATTEPTV